MNLDLRQAAAMLRAMALQHDAEGHHARELAFEIWRHSTVYPAAVNRWIRECAP
jgi:hypothetical protein